jgi:predicted ester cyclase
MGKGRYHKGCVQVTIHDLIGEGNQVAKLWSSEGTHEREFAGIAPTGKRITFRGITIYRASGDKVVGCIWRADALGLLQQLGAIPATQ